MNKKYIFVILLAVLVLPVLVSAQVTITGLVDGAVNVSLYIASGVVVILWVVTGILFLTAQGDPGKVKTARTALLTAVAGTVIVLIAGGALNFVKNAFKI